MIVSIDHAAGAVGVDHVEADLARWQRGLVGEGNAGGIPTPENAIAFLVTRDGKDLALFSYLSDGHGGWLRAGYTACRSALKS